MANNLSNLLGNTTKNTSNVDAISDKIAQSVVKILLSTNKIDALNLKGKKDLSGGRKIGNIDTARYTTISENQNVRMRKGDGVANVLSRLYGLLKGSHDKDVKQMELTRNFKEEKLKEGRKYSKVTHQTFGRKRRRSKTKTGLAGLAMLGLISSMDSIMDWMENFTAEGGGLDQMIETIAESWKSFKEEALNRVKELYNNITGRELDSDWEKLKEDFKKTIDADIGFGKQIIDDFNTGVYATLANVSKIAEGVTTTIFQKADEFATWVGEKYNYAMSTVTWVIDTFSNFKSMISKHLQSISAWFTEALKNPTAFLYGGGDLSNKIGKNNDEFIKSQKSIDEKHPEGGVINAGITAAKQIFNDVNYVAEKGSTWSAQAGEWVEKDLGLTGVAIGKTDHFISEEMNAATASVTSQFNEGGTVYETAKKIKDYNKDRVMPWTAINEARNLAPKIVVDKASKIANDVSESTRQFIETPKNSDDYSQRAAETSKYQQQIKTITKNTTTGVPGGKPTGGGVGANIRPDNPTVKKVNMGNVVHP